MESNKVMHCGPCGYEGITKDAKKWCTNCDEGCCGDCEKSHRSSRQTKDHKIIAIDDFLKIDDFSISLTCPTHGKKLDLYCKYHSGALCAVCVKSAHKTCRADDIISIDNVSKNAKGSTALLDLKEKITKTLENVKQCISDQMSASAKIDIDEQTIKNMVLETKLQLNRRLDELEEHLLNDLKMKHKKFKTIYSTLLQKLEHREKEFKNFREQTQRMKLHASDLELFLGTCQMNKTTMDKIELLKVEIGKEKNYAMDMKLHRVINSLMKNVKQFGEIHITETCADFQLQDANVDQAQMQVRGSKQDDTHYVELQLKRKFNIKLQHQSPGCVLLSDGRTLIADFWGSGKLLEYNEKGKYIRDVNVSDKPYDLTEIDTDRIAVTYPDVKRLEIMSIKKGTDDRKTLCEKKCFGISHCNGKIVTVVQEYCY
ncbi:E3 ubiquitin/ISG15 ligase TRIM25-like [Mytilus trossulus]|uniref:E3 ubiquitin/ISG15 ligase TRIM25-like n=1 Tax=Mytilus trossulus TaxID=6551 RepID=UPI003005D96B